MSFEIVKEIFVKNWPMFLRGAWVTLYVSIISTIIGTVIGFIVGVIKTAPNPKNAVSRNILKVVKFIFTVYVEVIRGTPMMVQAMVFFYGMPLLLGIDIPPLMSSIIIVSVNTGAYMAEIVRGGIISIDKGQFEAFDALGMSYIQGMIYIIVPQVLRNILPATGNEFVINIKDTSVLNVIQVTELYFQTKSLAGANFRYFETFLITMFIYLIMTFTVTRILRFMERKLDGPANFIMSGNQMQVQTPEVKPFEE
ncbi:MAG: amino acid ABC transporter permease [Tissierellia bacterium]|nr:amino acid ABC transporter permease [Tissierellia bacterium]